MSDGVAARLARQTGIRRVPSRHIELFVVPQFIDPATCAALVERIDRQRRPSEIADDHGEAGFRTSETCDLDGSDPLVERVERAIADLLGLDLGASEPMQGQRYSLGQEFRPHTDTFEPGGHDYFLNCAEAGNRTWTAMAYLNAVDAGGGTRFKEIGKIIQPVMGTVLAWNNLSPDGSPNPATLHQGMKVRKGAKYIITLWYRANPR